MFADTLNLITAAGAGTVLQPMLATVADRIPSKVKAFIPLVMGQGLAAVHAQAAGLPWEASLTNGLTIAAVATLKHKLAEFVNAKKASALAAQVTSMNSSKV